MNTSSARLSYLFNCYYQKTATQQERDELFLIIAKGKKDEELSDLIRTTWNELHIDKQFFTTNQTEQILSNILSNDRQQAPVKHIQSRNSFIKFAAAAITSLFIGLCFLYYKHDDKPIAQRALTQVKPAHDALPGTNKAILTLANGKKIILDNAHNGTLAKQGNTIVDKTTDGKVVYNLSNITDPNAAPAINTISTPRGGEYQIILPDGTKVWLNAASSISFPTRFTGNNREVQMTGEVYFEVTKNKLMPFKVKTNRAEIEVLGTHFNVMAYSDESLMKTTLLEGAVNIKTGTATNRLKPGEQAQVNATGNTRVTADIDVDDEVAWKNGIFQFNSAGVDVILRQASRWYDVDIIYHNKVPAKELSGHLSRKVKASELLNMLKYTGLNLHIEGKNIIVE